MGRHSAEAAKGLTLTRFCEVTNDVQEQTQRRPVFQQVTPLETPELTAKQQHI